MSYDELVDSLEAASKASDETAATGGAFENARRIVALPDGSVDYWYRVRGLEGDRLVSREEFGRQLLEGGGDTFSIERIDVRPGGQAVNAATQVHALGDEVVLVGHLEHSVLAAFPFETYSMGPPARINVLAFDDEEVLLAEVDVAGESAGDDGEAGSGDGEKDEDGDGDGNEDGDGNADVDTAVHDGDEGGTDWGLADIASVVDPTLLTDADALCCANWVSYPGLTEVLSFLGSTASTALPVVLDPGAVGTADEGAVADLCEALSRAEAAVDVVVSVNHEELESMARVLGAITDDDSIEPGGDFEQAPAELESVRSALGITAVVLHGTEVAGAATAAGSHEVPMLSVGEVTLTTGAGDRFSAALTSALARDWTWERALALANACSAHVVETGETADASGLSSFVRDRW